MFWMLVSFRNGKHWYFLVRSRPRGAACIIRSLHCEKYFSIQKFIFVHTHFRHCYFLWNTMTCHGFTHEILNSYQHLTCNVFSVSLNSATEPHSSSLTNEENLTRNFGQSVHICCREIEKKKIMVIVKPFALTTNAKNCKLTSYAIIIGQRTFFYHKFCL